MMTGVVMVEGKKKKKKRGNNQRGNTKMTGGGKCSRWLVIGWAETANPSMDGAEFTYGRPECGLDGVPHDERDPSEGETASTVSQWPNLGVGCACDIHKPTSSSSNLECLQLGRIHGSARLPASVAGNVYEVRQGGVPTCKEAPVITVAYFWHNERVVVGSSEAEVVCGGRPRAEVTGVGPEQQGATMKPGALHTNSEVAIHSPPSHLARHRAAADTVG